MLSLFGGSARAKGRTRRNYNVRFILEDLHVDSSTHEVFVTGNTEELGCYSAERAIPMTKTSRGRWFAVATLPADTTAEYRYLIRVRRDGKVSSEHDLYRQVKLTDDELEMYPVTINVADTWQSFDSRQASLPDESRMQQLTLASRVGKSEPFLQELLRLRIQTAQEAADLESVVQERVTSRTDRLQGQNAELVRQITKLRDRLRELEGARDAAEEKANEAETRYHELTTAQASLAVRDSRIAGLERSLRDQQRLQCVFHCLEANNKSFGARYARKLYIFSPFVISIAIRSEGNDKRLKKAIAEAASNIARSQRLERELQQVKANVMTPQRRHAIETAARERVNEELQAARAEVTKLRARISKLETRLREEKAARKSFARSSMEPSHAARRRGEGDREEVTMLYAEKEALEASLQQARESYDALLQEHTQLEESKDALEQDARISRERADALDRALEDTEELAEADRKRAHDAESRIQAMRRELLELKGNIRVFARVRPQVSRANDGDESATDGEDESPAIQIPSSDRLIVEAGEEEGEQGTTGMASGSSQFRNRTYLLDNVFGPQSSQDEIFDEVEPFVHSALDGYDVTIMAYGATGAGKTFTMQGTDSEPGVSVRAIEATFHEMEKRQSHQSAHVYVSMLEIYNESLRDLLPGSTERRIQSCSGDDDIDEIQQQPLEIRQGPDGIFVQGLQEEEVDSAHAVMELIQQGLRRRAVSTTVMNEVSSRSHMVLCLRIHTEDAETGVGHNARMYMIDLAGSERLKRSEATGARRLETQHINKSLSALGDVMAALQSKQKHVPFRNSKLTHLLQDALAPGNKALLIFQVAPGRKNVGESLCTLNFAQRAASVELGKAVRRLDAGPLARARQEVSHLRARVNDLEAEVTRLRQLKTPGPASSKPKSRLARLRAKRQGKNRNAATDSDSSNPGARDSVESVMEKESEWRSHFQTLPAGFRPGFHPEDLQHDSRFTASNRFGTAQARIQSGSPWKAEVEKEVASADADTVPEVSNKAVGSGSAAPKENNAMRAEPKQQQASVDAERKEAATRENSHKEPTASMTSPRPRTAGLPPKTPIRSSGTAAKARTPRSRVESAKKPPAEPKAPEGTTTPRRLRGQPPTSSEEAGTSVTPARGSRTRSPALRGGASPSPGPKRRTPNRWRNTPSRVDTGQSALRRAATNTPAAPASSSSSAKPSSRVGRATPNSAARSTPPVQKRLVREKGLGRGGNAANTPPPSKAFSPSPLGKAPPLPPSPYSEDDSGDENRDGYCSEEEEGEEAVPVPAWH